MEISGIKEYLWIGSEAEILYTDLPYTISSKLMGIISLLGDLNLWLAFLIWYQGDTPFQARDQASGPVEITEACEAATV